MKDGKNFGCRRNILSANVMFNLYVNSHGYKAVPNSDTTREWEFVCEKFARVTNGQPQTSAWMSILISLSTNKL